ncbi:MAG: helix-turn-helix domain-containing protein [Bacteroidales bacterium]|nr:helix-turn-helix domain-containing protein [Bacteroidales bacterium]
MKSIVDILNRIKKIENVKSEYAIARILNKNQGTITNWKKRNIIPFEVLYSYCNKKKISFDWLLSGKGDHLVSPEAKNNNDLILDRKIKNLISLLNQLDEKEKNILINSFTHIIKFKE